MFEGRRGISPLVATVLLIAFSVALGAVVMSWGESYIEQRAEFVSGKPEVGGPCDTALISIIKLEGKPQACLRGSTVELFIENGQRPLDGIKVSVTGSDGVHLVDNVLAKKLDPADSVKVTVTPTAIGTIKQIKLTPILLINNEQQFCTQSQTIIEPVQPC